MALCAHAVNQQLQALYGRKSRTHNRQFCSTQDSPLSLRAMVLQADNLINARLQTVGGWEK